MARRKPRQSRKKSPSKTVHFPDSLAKYYSVKYPSTWRKFKEYATSIDKFEKGVGKLCSRLAKGDEQDRRVFGYIPISFLKDNSVKITIKQDNGDIIILGDGDNDWTRIEERLKFEGTSIVTNLDEMPNPDNYDSAEDKETAIAMRDHIEAHPVIKKALSIFGGSIVGYKPKDTFV